MFSFIKNYFWNIASIILIIIIAECLFFYNKNASYEYKKIQKLEIKLTCEVDNRYFHLKLNFCPRFVLDIQKIITPYVLSFYSLDEKKTKFVTNHIRNVLFYEVNFEINLNEKIIKINEKELEKLILTNAENYFKITKALKINDYLYFQRRLRSDKYFSVQDDGNYHILQFYIEEIENIKNNEIIDVYFKYSLNEKKIKNKFSRLNFFNVFLISLVFGIYINIIAIVLLQNNLLKK